MAAKKQDRDPDPYTYAAPYQAAFNKALSDCPIRAKYLLSPRIPSPELRIHKLRLLVEWALDLIAGG